MNRTNGFWNAIFALLFVATVLFAEFVSGQDTPDIKRTRNWRPAEIILKTGRFDPIQSPPVVPKSLRKPEPVKDREYYLLQLNRHATSEIKDQLGSLGVTFVHYIPQDAFIVRVLPKNLAEIKLLPTVRWVDVFRPFYKIDPEIGKRPFSNPARKYRSSLFLLIEIFPGEEVDAVAEKLKGLGIEILKVHDTKNTHRILIKTTPDRLEPLARIREIEWIEETPEITLRNNDATWVVQTNTPNVRTIWDKGIHGENQIIGIIDSTVNKDSCYFKDSTNNTPGPGHRKILAFHSTSTVIGTHGTHVAGTAVGLNVSGSLDNAGHAYNAKMVYSSLDDVQGLSGDITVSNLYDMLTTDHTDGARIHTNSWGDDGTTAYTALAVDIDRFSYDQEDSLVLFAVTNLGSLKTPENAKDVLAVGATQRSTSDEFHCTGGSGPTSDGRRKPEIYAPGCSTVSAGTGDCNTASLTGTSMASPVVAGAAALVRQYYMEGWASTGIKTPSNSVTPTGALIKATLLNGTQDMTGVSGYPSNQEGWGRVNLDQVLFFNGDTRRLAFLDVRNSAGMVTEQRFQHNLVLSSSGEFKVTLVWTDPPGSLQAASAPINNLDLEVVSPTGSLYVGNQFLNGESTTGGSADTVNNVEQVLFKNATAGSYTIRVKGTEINDGPTQGFALVASGPLDESSDFPKSSLFSFNVPVLTPGGYIVLVVVLVWIIGRIPRDSGQSFLDKIKYNTNKNN